ncbi:PH domain-containing protein [bacterium]|nr:PH domain-containing protein [bacterium]
MPEEKIWRGRPSHLLSIGYYGICLLFCWLIVPLVMGIIRFLTIQTTEYELTTERIKLRRGIFSKENDDIELYRVKEFHVEEPLVLRVFGYGNLKIETTDRGSSRIFFEGIPNPLNVRDLVRNQVEINRSKKGVREVDINPET